MMLLKLAQVTFFTCLSVMVTADGQECMTEECKEQGSSMLQAKQQRESKMNVEYSGSGACTDTDSDGDANDPYGDGCDEYRQYPSWCGPGKYDDNDFSNTNMCCICGGGDKDTSPAPVPPPGPPTQPGTCGAKGPDDTLWAPSPDSVDTLIVNGQKATKCEWKWQASLREKSGFAFCGGTLIHPNWVFTAAHCVQTATPSSMNVVLGDFDKSTTVGSDEKTMSVERIVSHPSYNSNSMTHDFALIQLKHPAPLGSCIGVACLPSQPIGGDEVCWITGWGTLSSGGSTPKFLQEAAVTTWTNVKCARKYGANSILDDMLCANGRNSDGGVTDGCQGDSGGPLVCKDSSGKYSVHGATSWGAGCADVKYPGIWARTTSVLDWIKETSGVTPPLPTESSPPAPAPYAAFASSIVRD